MIVDRLLLESRFEPKLLEKNVTKKGKELKEACLLEKGEKISSLFEDDEQVKALAGEAYMKEITEDKITVVEAQLSKLADTVLKDWRRRQTQSELEKAASDLLFHVELNEGEGVTVDDEHYVNSGQILTKLSRLIKALPQSQRDKFDEAEILPGLYSYLQYWKDLKSVPQNEVYSSWYKRYVKILESQQKILRII